MVKTVPEQEFDVILKFGGGQDSSASEEVIDAREASEALNYILDLRNAELRNRPAIDLVWSAPNGSQINGFGQLLKADGTVTTLVQAGTVVYSTDFTSQTQVGTVTAGTKLRGHLWHNFTLDDVLILTDIALVNPVLEWNGTTLSTMTHNLTGDLIAKYAFTQRERLWLGHIKSNGVLTPHAVLASKVSDYNNLSTGTKPSSALGDDDPFWLLTPDLKPINGLLEAFGLVVLSSQRGNIFKISGASAKDFAILPLYPRSGAVGDESLTYVGNDIAYGRQGAIELLSRTDKFADVELDDVSLKIADQVLTVDSWCSVFNSRLKRSYWFGDNSDAWVLFKSVLDAGEVSPWVKFESTLFPPTATMELLDPRASNLNEAIFFGDTSGNVYRMEGSGAGGDGGSADITTRFKSKLFTVPLDLEAYNVTGWLKYHKGDARDIKISLLWAGQSVVTETFTESLEADGSGWFFGGDFYWGGDIYWGTSSFDRLIKRPITIPGQSSEFQVEVESTGKTDFRINEIGLRFTASN